MPAASTSVLTDKFDCIALIDATLIASVRRRGQPRDRAMLEAARTRRDEDYGVVLSRTVASVLVRAYEPK
jgi:hypothetical protein